MWTCQEIFGATLLGLVLVEIFIVVGMAIFLKMDDDRHRRPLKKRLDKK